MPQEQSRFKVHAVRPAPTYAVFGCKATTVDDNTVRVAVSGELDLATSGTLANALEKGGRNARVVVLDLHEVTFVDTSGVHVIADALNDAQRAGRRLLVLPGGAVVDRLFSLTGTLSQIAAADGAGSAMEDLLPESAVRESISKTMLDLYTEFYAHGRTTATTYIRDNVVLCVLENVLSSTEVALIAAGQSGNTIDGWDSFQVAAEDELAAAIERLTGRRVVASLNANQTRPGVACALFFLDAPPPEGGG